MDENTEILSEALGKQEENILYIYIFKTYA